MSKIVQAVNAMIENKDLLSSVIPSGKEIYFLYKQRHKWSMVQYEDGYHRLFFYPSNRSLEEIAAMEPEDWEHFSEMVVYYDKEGAREAKESFADLYAVLKEKVYGMDKVLDEIIEDSTPF